MALLADAEIEDFLAGAAGWIEQKGLPREKLRDLLLAAFAASLLAAQQVDHKIRLDLGLSA